MNSLKKEKKNLISVTLTKSNYFKSIFFIHLKKMKSTIIVLFIIINIVTFLAIQQNKNNTGEIMFAYLKILPVLIIFVLIYFLYELYKIKKNTDKAFETINQSQIEQKFLLESDGIKVTFPNKYKIKYKWYQIIQLNESKYYLYIFISKSNWLLIPKNSETEFFRLKIKENVK